jgi:hypothetical protein
VLGGPLNRPSTNCLCRLVRPFVGLHEATLLQCASFLVADILVGFGLGRASLWVFVFLPKPWAVQSRRSAAVFCARSFQT